MACCGGTKVKNDKFSNFSDACYNGNVEKMQELFKKESKGRDPALVVNERDKRSKTNENELAPLHRAAQKGNCTVIRFLLEHGADPRILSKSGETPLHIACFHRHADAVSELLKTAAKNDVNTKEKTMEMTPLHVAVWRGAQDIVQLLLKAGANPLLKDKNKNDCFDHAEFWARQEKEGMRSPQAQHLATLKLLETVKTAA